MRKPRYRHAGNAALIIELGDKPSPDLDFYTMALGEHLRQSADTRILDCWGCAPTILIEFDPQTITSPEVIKLCNQWIASMPPYDRFTMPSRRVEIPVCYNDRWTRECAAENQCDFDLLMQLNQCTEANDLIRRHTACHWWVAAVDFPGMPILKQLGAQTTFKAPKYKSPRMRTPTGTVVLGDTFTLIYPNDIPDGFRMLGRTPVPFYDPEIFSCSSLDLSMMTLCTGDRVLFRPVSEEEFLSIEASVASGSYKLDIEDEREMTFAEFLASGGEDA